MCKTYKLRVCKPRVARLKELVISNNDIFHFFDQELISNNDIYKLNMSSSPNNSFQSQTENFPNKI